MSSNYHQLYENQHSRRQLFAEGIHVHHDCVATARLEVDVWKTIQLNFEFPQTILSGIFLSGIVISHSLSYRLK